ncbi:MAG: hypothetical protein POH28_11500, partial [Acidocella sp.]|nr:hypothetical protein [Acidocella sp.]
ARDAMFAASDIAAAPWMVVDANDKKPSRLAVIADIISRVDYPGAKAHPVDDKLIRPAGGGSDP